MPGSRGGWTLLGIGHEPQEDLRAVVDRTLASRLWWLLCLTLAVGPAWAARADEQTPAAVPGVDVPTLGSARYSERVTTLEIGDPPITFQAPEQLGTPDPRIQESATRLVLSLTPLWVDYESGDLASRALDQAAPWQSLARASAPAATFGNGPGSLAWQANPTTPVLEAPILLPQFYRRWR
jgi:hypothetical protein